MLKYFLAYLGSRVKTISNLPQHQIRIQHARIYRAWLPFEIFPKYGNAVEWEKVRANRLRRATKRGKFSRTVWVFDVVQNSRQWLSLP